jgi:hypothetical protein
MSIVLHRMLELAAVVLVLVLWLRGEGLRCADVVKVIAEVEVKVIAEVVVEALEFEVVAV